MSPRFELFFPDIGAHIRGTVQLSIPEVEVVRNATELPVPEVQVAYVLRSTAYNSVSGQTDSTPNITATGERTQHGIVALSRDMLEMFPYGTTVKILDIRSMDGAPNGCGATPKTIERLPTLPGLSPGEFRVADTMHPRKQRQVDVWLDRVEYARNWGVCEVVLAKAN
ncbi:MAG: hypothetical protein U5L75_03565 [Candidatus Campbellbacteria bacterium]|nr:hypothetical protein [Candidatus Campbellbacteria bacterium]